MFDFFRQFNLKLRLYIGFFLVDVAVVLLACLAWWGHHWVHTALQNGADQAEILARLDLLDAWIPWVMGVIVFGTLLVSISWVVVLANTLSVTLGNVVAHLQRVSRGDLVTRLNDKGRDELSFLCNGVDSFAQVVAQTFCKLQTAVSGVAHTSSDIQHEVTQVSENLDAQAVAVTTVVDSMAQARETVVRVGEDVEQIRQKSLGIEQQIENVDGVVEELQHHAAEIALMAETIQGFQNKQPCWP